MINKFLGPFPEATPKYFQALVWFEEIIIFLSVTMVVKEPCSLQNCRCPGLNSWPYQSTQEMRTRIRNRPVAVRRWCRTLNTGTESRWLWIPRHCNRWVLRSASHSQPTWRRTVGPVAKLSVCTRSAKTPVLARRLIPNQVSTTSVSPSPSFIRLRPVVFSLYYCYRSLGGLLRSIFR